MAHDFSTCHAAGGRRSQAQATGSGGRCIADIERDHRQRLVGHRLTTGGSLDGVTYPVATVNGGKTWRIDGPVLHVPAANGPDAVTQIGAAGPATFFAYGGPGGANSVDVSADGGRRWFRAFLGGGIVGAVVESSGELFAFTGTRGAYYSKDGGRTWHYTKSVP